MKNILISSNNISNLKIESKFNLKENKFKITFELEGFNFKEFDLYNVACILLTKENERTFWSLKHQLSVPNFHERRNFLKIT